MAARKKSDPAKKAPAKAPPRSTKKFLRNMTGVDVALRLERQERPKKRTELKPRGQRGDLMQLQKDDLTDPIVNENVALGLVEIITEAEAKKVIDGQSTNQQQEAHPALKSLRNELGEELERVVVEPREAERGKVVARLDDGQVPNEKGGQGVDWERAKMENPASTHEQPIRNTSVNPRDIPVEGAVDIAEVQDAAARSKSAQSAADLGLKVTVEPTQKS